MEFSVSQVINSLLFIGIGLGTGWKLFRSNGNGKYVTKDWCERTHAAEEKRHDELMAQLGAIWKKLDNVDIRTAHIEGALKQVKVLSTDQTE